MPSTGKARGIVKIEIHNPDNYNLEPGRAALKFMTRILHNGDYVGVSMGSALQSTARAVRRLHKLGNLGIGSNKRKLGPGSVVIIACKSDGTITGGEEITGLTIFNCFKEIRGIVGTTR